MGKEQWPTTDIMTIVLYQFIQQYQMNDDRQDDIQLPSIWKGVWCRNQICECEYVWLCVCVNEQRKRVPIYSKCHSLSFYDVHSFHFKSNQNKASYLGADLFSIFTAHKSPIKWMENGKSWHENEHSNTNFSGKHS